MESGQMSSAEVFSFPLIGHIFTSRKHNKMTLIPRAAARNAPRRRRSEKTSEVFSDIVSAAIASLRFSKSCSSECVIRSSLMLQDRDLPHTSPVTCCVFVLCLCELIVPLATKLTGIDGSNASVQPNFYISNQAKS